MEAVRRTYRDSTACRGCFRGWWGEFYEGDPCPNCGTPLTLTGTVIVMKLKDVK